MKYILPIVIALALAIGLRAHNPNTEMNDLQANPGDVKVMLHTTMGDITLLLYGDTPLHTANFVKLVNEGFYDGLLFHRVIDSFMIQGGDPTSKDAPKGKHLGAGDPSYRIDAEIDFPKHFHHRGALAAAREGDATNPERKSSGSQFYIVTGKKFSPAQLDQMEHKAVMRHKQEVFDSLSMQHRDSIMAMRRNRDQAGLEALREQLAVETEGSPPMTRPTSPPNSATFICVKAAHRISTAPTQCSAASFRAWTPSTKSKRLRLTAMTARWKM